MANHVELSREAIRWINGELLGDGCLQSYSKQSACFQYGSQHLEYVQYVAHMLREFGIEQVGKTHKYSYKGYAGCSYTYASRSYIELLPLQKVWYPEGKKEVPRDMRLSPVTCRQWYIGDGSLCCGISHRPYIVLCTDSFSVLDVEWLISELSEIGILATRYPSNNRICISTYSTIDFLNYIGQCPVECYLYKWKYI